MANKDPLQSSINKLDNTMNALNKTVKGLTKAFTDMNRTETSRKAPSQSLNIEDALIKALHKYGPHKKSGDKGLYKDYLTAVQKVVNDNRDFLVKYEKIRESVIVAAALHDLGKMGQFEKPEYVENVLASGKVSDAKPYKRNPDLLNVPHEIRSVAIATMFIDLTEEEQHAILYHNGLYGPLRYEIQGNETPLYMIIHWADMWASRVMESKNKKGEE